MRALSSGLFSDPTLTKRTTPARSRYPMANKPQKRVLYVEASDLVQASHPPALEQLNCLVVQVSSAPAALEALASQDPFNLILVGDVSRPTENPEAELSVIRRARQQDAEVPILVFTSHNYLQQAYQAGATAHMEKPAGVMALIEFVTPYLFHVSEVRPRKQDFDDTVQ